ncbi:MAG: hypothetical protein ABIO70_10120 [Pseudomonadota bacterium]
MTPAARERTLMALFGVLPALWVVQARGAAIGPFSVDLAGHLWNGWAFGQAGWFHTRMTGWPDGVDLLPAVGGWLDLFGVAALRHLVPLELAYDLVIGVYLVVAGLGAWVLARALGATRPAAVVAGLMLQLDGFVLTHLHGGRPEQVGLGFLSLLLGLALMTWRGTGRAAPVLAGLACALLALVSWELFLLGGLCLAFALPFLRWDSRPPGLGRRLLLAGGVALATAGPWVVFFLLHAARVRAFDEAEFSRQLAGAASAPLLGMLEPGRTHPPIGALTCLLLLPWTLRRRALIVGLGLGLAAALLFAAGPHPGLRVPGDLGFSGPFGALHGLPVLGWFHWPDRLLATWSLAAAAAAALALDLAARRRRWLAVVLAPLLLAGAIGEALLGQRWPGPTWRLEHPHDLTRLAELPEPGAVLDLPIQPDPARHLPYQIDQLTHGRPILLGHVLAHLQDRSFSERLERDPVLSWFHELMGDKAPSRERFSPEDFSALVEAGYAFVTLHKRGWPQARWARSEALLRKSLGEPVIQQGPDWICWRLPRADNKGGHPWPSKSSP